MPRLSVLEDDYGPHGFAALAINLGEDMEGIIKPWARQNTNLYLRDPGSVWPVYTQNNAIPLNYVVDTAGVIRFIEEGFTETTIRQIVQAYLPDPITQDVAVTRIIAPSGSFDSGATRVPACSLRNYGLAAETYPVRMRIGASYDTMVTVSGHAPGTARYVEFPLWTALDRGNVAVTCTTELDGDDIRNNNALHGSIAVNVYDVELVAVLAPADTVDSGAVVVPRAVVANRGTLADMAKVKFFIGDAYAESASVALQPGRTDTAELRGWSPAQTGGFAWRCTVATVRAEMVPANNRLTGFVWVVPAGIEEPAAGPGPAARFDFAPNPARAGVPVRCAVPPGAGRLRIADALGRTVLSLPTGGDAVEFRLPAGAYVARFEARGRTLGRKLVVTD